MFGFGRRPRASAGGADGASLADEIRRTIVRLDDQRRAATAAAGRALVNQAEVRRACAEQLRTLDAATTEAQRAEALARRAADAARGDAETIDAAEYDRTASGLSQTQQLLAAASDPISTLLAQARANSDQARLVLTQARTVLGEQVRTQIRLLRDLERVERARIVRDSRE